MDSLHDPTDVIGRYHKRLTGDTFEALLKRAAYVLDLPDGEGQLVFVPPALCDAYMSHVDLVGGAYLRSSDEAPDRGCINVAWFPTTMSLGALIELLTAMTPEIRRLARLSGPARTAMANKSTFTGAVGGRGVLAAILKRRDLPTPNWLTRFRKETE